MDSSLLMLFGMGGRIDRATLNDIIVSGNDRRRKYIMKGADLLFGLVMLIWGDLTWKDKAGNTIDPTEKDASGAPKYSTDAKVDLMLQSMRSVQKSTLFRELLRPFIIDVAEVLAGLLEPDPFMVNLLASGPQGGIAAPGYMPPAGYLQPVPQMGPGYVHVAPQAPPAQPAPNPIASMYEGRLLKDHNDPRVFHIVSGKKSWVTSGPVFDARGYKWPSVLEIPMATIAQIPDGPPEY